MEADQRTATGVALRFAASGTGERQATLRSITLRAALAVLVAAVALLLGAASARAADPVIAAAGDIACDPSDSSYRGGAGTSSACRQRYTSDLLVDAGLSKVLVLGDNQYDDGSLSRYQASYDPSWGRVKSITRPVPGNHEPGNASGYFDYFNGSGVNNGPAGQRGKGWYSYDIGNWHLIALNSKCDRVDCTAGGEQEQWLRADLAANADSCILAYWHHARFSSGHDGDNPFVQPFWQALYEAQADVVLNGHSHNYERFAPMDANGSAASGGIREFVVGTGGSFFTGVSGARPNSVVRQNHTYGVLMLTLHQNSYDWEFVPEAGKTFSDSGSANCHRSGGPPLPDTQPPTTPTNPVATAPSSARVDLSWRASTDNVGVIGYEIYRDGALIATRSGLSHADTTVGPETTYSYRVRAFDAAGNRSPLSSVATVTTPPPPDTEPPAAPENLAGTAVSSVQVDLSWSPSTDNKGVTGYEIYRDGAFLATAGLPGYSDPTASPSTAHSYRVRALDAAGNRSAFGDPATVTTPVATILTLDAEADARVEQSRASTNFGSSFLRTDGGGSSAVDSYLKFLVSGAAGPVERAKLRVRADSSTVDGPAVYTSGTGWSESGITWASRPDTTSGATGDKGAVSSNSWVEYDVTPFVTGNGTYSFRLATSSSDGLDIRSREHSDAGSRPELLLTVGEAPREEEPPVPPPGPPGAPLVPPQWPFQPPAPFSPLHVGARTPRLTLDGPKSQRLARRGVHAIAQCSERCGFTANAEISPGRASRPFRSQEVKRVLGASAQGKLRFKFSRRAVRAVRRALRRKQRLFATVTVQLVEPAGSAQTARRKIRLRR